MDNQDNHINDELKIIKKQLGRKPDNLRRVVARCPAGKPLVIETYPFSEEHGVFPTTYWLSCPYWVEQIFKLEDKGLIQELSHKIQNDDKLRNRLEEAHKNYAEKRFALIKEDDIKKIINISFDILQVLKESGVGGIQEKEGIKCLHTHVADQIVHENNPVGETVIEYLTSLTSCDKKSFCEIDDNTDKGGVNK